MNTDELHAVTVKCLDLLVPVRRMVRPKAGFLAGNMKLNWGERLWIGWPFWFS